MVAFHQALGTGPRDSWRRRSKRNPLKPSGAREFGFLQSRALEALGPAFLPVKVTSCQSAFLLRARQNHTHFSKFGFAKTTGFIDYRGYFVL